MNAVALLREIQIKFPHAMRVEIAAAFDLDDRRVADIIMTGGAPRKPSNRQRQQSDVLIHDIKRYADTRLGGTVEIILLRCEPPALCVDGRLVA